MITIVHILSDKDNSHTLGTALNSIRITNNKLLLDPKPVKQMSLFKVDVI